MNRRIVEAVHTYVGPVLRRLRPSLLPLLSAPHARRVAAALSIADLREAARLRTHPMAFSYLDGGADDEVSLRRNKDAFTELELHYHVLAGHKAPLDLSTHLWGHTLKRPFFNAPSAANRMFHADGELAVASASGARGMAYSLSSFSTSGFDAVADAHNGTTSDSAGASANPVSPPKVFQLYVWRDRGFLRDLLARAKAAGFGVLALTADLSWFGNREREVRAGFAVPPAYSARQLVQAMARPAWSFDLLSTPPLSYALIDPTARAEAIAAIVTSKIDESFGWADAEWLCGEWQGPVLLKGVVRPDDAARAVASGFTGVWVSNHGGRQLETAPAPIDVLPEIRAAVGYEASVVLDGGVQRGVDVAKALASGADAVALGKPTLYGLCAGGEAGVGKAFDLLAAELERAMGLIGVGSVEELKRKGPQLLRRRQLGVRDFPHAGPRGPF